MAHRLPTRPLHHKARELGYCRLGGQQVYLGHWPRHHKKPPAAVEAEFRRQVAEWLREHPADARPAGTAPPAGNLLVSELWLHYLRRCEGYFQKNREQTSEMSCQRGACRVMARLFGHLPAAEISPRHLLDVRDVFIANGYTRKTVNGYTARVVAMFRWGAEVEQERLFVPIPDTVPMRLERVKPLQKDRCGDVPEGEATEVVDMDLVRRTLAHCRPVVRAMVEVQYLLGCRCQDVVTMRPALVQGCLPEHTNPDPVHGFWLYWPEGYKTAHKAKGSAQEQQAAALTYWVDPEAQVILRPLIAACATPQSYLFTTAGAAGVRADSRGCYRVSAYRRHIERAVEKLFPPEGVLARRTVLGVRGRSGPRFARPETDKERHARLTDAERQALREWIRAHGWYPYQLRHTRITELGGLIGTEKAQRIVGHLHLRTTEIYAKKHRAEARDALAEYRRLQRPRGAVG